MRGWVAALALALPQLSGQASGQGTGAEIAKAPGAMIRTLDKVTGQTADFDIDEGDSTRLGTLTVTLGECRYPADDPASNAYGWITVLDDAAAAPLFQGWMIAAAPALNALDHQRYDVWLIRCRSSEG